MSVFIKNGFLVIMDKNKNESNESFTKKGGLLLVKNQIIQKNLN